MDPASGKWASFLTDARGQEEGEEQEIGERKDQTEFEPLRVPKFSALLSKRPRSVARQEEVAFNSPLLPHSPALRAVTGGTVQVNCLGELSRWIV